MVTGGEMNRATDEVINTVAQSDKDGRHGNEDGRHGNEDGEDYVNDDSDIDADVSGNFSREI